MKKILLITYLIISQSILLSVYADDNLKIENYIPEGTKFSFPPYQISFSKNKLNLHDISYQIVSDKKFKDINDTDIQIILKYCELILYNKFPISKVHWKKMPSLTISDYFKSTNSMIEGVLDLSNPDDLDKYFSKWKAFYQQWPLKELMTYLPTNKKNHINNYGKFTNYVQNIVKERLFELASIKGLDGKPFLNKYSFSYYSMARWSEITKNQSDAFISITNVPILFDDAYEPYIHSLLGSMSTSGRSLNIYSETFVSNRIYTTLFNARTQNKFFKPIPKVSRKMENIITAVYTLVHEFVHNLFLMPDNYNHPSHCLMYSSNKLNRLQHTNILINDLRPCEKCKIYITARMNEFKGDLCFQNKNYGPALLFYSEASKMPKHVVCSYERWYAQLNYKMIKCMESGEIEIIEE